MAFLKVVSPNKKHDCEKPFPMAWMGVGTVWQCDDCGKIWELCKEQLVDSNPPKFYVVWNEKCSA
jgi:hypothetical protein